MSSLFANLSAVLLVFCGFAAISLTIKRHYADIHGRGEAGPQLSRYLTVGGWIALAVSLTIFIALEQFGNGLMLWCGTLTASGWILVLMLNYTTRQVIPAAGISLVLALLVGIVALFMR